MFVGVDSRCAGGESLCTRRATRAVRAKIRIAQDSRASQLRRAPGCSHGAAVAHRASMEVLMDPTKIRRKLSHASLLLCATTIVGCAFDVEREPRKGIDPIRSPATHIKGDVPDAGGDAADAATMINACYCSTVTRADGVVWCVVMAPVQPLATDAAPPDAGPPLPSSIDWTVPPEVPCEAWCKDALAALATDPPCTQPGTAAFAQA